MSIFALLQEQKYAELMVRQQQAEVQLRRQCEELHVHSQKELQQVQEELARLQREFSQSLLIAESEKQQVCEVVFIDLVWFFKSFCREYFRESQALRNYPVKAYVCIKSGSLYFVTIILQSMYCVAPQGKFKYINYFMLKILQTTLCFSSMHTFT